MLDHANKVLIQNSKLISADTIHNHVYADHDPLDSLKPHHVQEAHFDSKERYDPPKCHPETRVLVLSNIEAWAQRKLHPECPILWLRGGAGAGKSAIAQTLSERWSTSVSLAASFFFSRTGAGRDQSKYFITTIAYQIFHSIPRTRPYIEYALSTQEGLFDRPLKQQIMALIVYPLIAPYTEPLPHMIVVIDGLDECSLDYPNQNHEEQQREILEALAEAAPYLGSLRFLVASRPERQIRESFRDKYLEPLVFKITLDNKYNPDADIELFLRCSFREIREKHRDLGKDWPSWEVIHRLVSTSSGHFVYASTIMRYISDPRADPRRRLEVILGLLATEHQYDRPFAQLDVLYTHIMSTIQPHSLGNVLRIFGIMKDPDVFEGRAPFGSSLTTLSPDFFSKLLFTSSKQIYCDLIDLHSILEIPRSLHSSGAAVRFLHASFSEFLSDPTRSGIYYIEPRAARLTTCLSLTKHIILCIAEKHKSMRTYSERDLLDALIRGLDRSQCLPSRELKFGLHLLSGRGYRRFDENVESVGLPLDELKKLKPVGLKLSRLDKFVIVNYLQSCNTKEIEESTPRRWLMRVILAAHSHRLDLLITAKRECTSKRIFVACVIYSIIIIPTIVIIVVYLQVGRPHGK